MNELDNGNLYLDPTTRHITLFLPSKKKKIFNRHLQGFLFYSIRNITDKIHEGNLFAFIPESKSYIFLHLLKILCELVISIKADAVLR